MRIGRRRPTSSSASAARIRCVCDSWKDLSKSAPDTEVARSWFANLLWVAFPSESETELCRKAGLALGCSPRQVKNWLNCANDAPVRAVTSAIVIAGAEVAFRVYEGDRK